MDGTRAALRESPICLLMSSNNFERSVPNVRCVIPREKYFRYSTSERRPTHLQDTTVKPSPYVLQGPGLRNVHLCRLPAYGDFSSHMTDPASIRKENCQCIQGRDNEALKATSDRSHTAGRTPQQYQKIAANLFRGVTMRPWRRPAIGRIQRRVAIP
jgi:hypothetical protein